MAEWNPGSYHDSLHPMYVAEVVAALATSLEREPDCRGFLCQVALLHDADPRPAGTPASVFRTLEWMVTHKTSLLRTLQWTDAAFDVALVLIARTDFPFDNKPRHLGTCFDGHSPYTLYRELMGRLPVELRAEVLENGQLLRFADQCANYCRDFETASLSVDDLSQEMARVGRPVSRWDLDTATFLDSLASDSSWDARLQHELEIEGRVFTRSELMQLLPGPVRNRLQRNQDNFRQERRGKQAG